MKKEDLIKNLKEIVDIATKSIASQENINNDATDLYIASFCSSIIQYTDAIISLAETDNLIAIPPILRSILEAYVELLNLCKHENYQYVLTSNHFRQKIKKLQVTFEEPDNPYLQYTIENFGDIGNRIKEYRKQKYTVDQHISNFDKDITKIKDRFELAGIKDLYAGIYGQLCEDAHNEILRVESRHLKKNENSTEFSVLINWDLEKISHHILTAMDILKSSLIYTFDNLDFANLDVFLPEIEKREKIINSYFE